MAGTTHSFSCGKKKSFLFKIFSLFLPGKTSVDQSFQLLFVTQRFCQIHVKPEILRNAPIKFATVNAEMRLNFSPSYLAYPVRVGNPKSWLDLFSLSQENNFTLTGKHNRGIVYSTQLLLGVKCLPSCQKETIP